MIHIAQIDELEERTHCDICDMDIENKERLNTHNLAHTEDMLLTVKMPVVDMGKNNVLCLRDFD